MINNCTVNSRADYLQCINEMKKRPNQGYCHTINAIQRRNTSIPCRYLLIYMLSSSDVVMPKLFVLNVPMIVNFDS